MKVTALDHIVLCVRDVPATIRFYGDLLGMEAREERPGKFSLHFGAHKISLQDVETRPAIARATVPGSANFCLLADEPVADLVAALKREGVTVLEGPAERTGAQGPILSVYFNDPDGNLVEVSNRL